MVIRVRKALAAAKPELLLDSSYFVPWLLPGKARLFTPVSYTERPAVAAAKICEGKIVVLVNGSPSAMVLPALFCENFECLDDYASTAVFSSFLRILKYVSFYLTVFLPGVFVCLAVYLPELIPPQLLYKIEAAEKATPLPLFAEMLLVILILEVIREAGLRMPQSLGHSVSLVSALIIGDAAIATGLMSTPVIFVASITAIAVFVTPSLYEPATLLRLGVVLAAGLAGPVGLAGAFFAVLLSLSGTACLQVPYLAAHPFPQRPWQRMASSAATTAAFQRTTLISGRNGRENDAKTERLFCSRAGTERVDSCAGRRNADRYLSAWDDHSWSGSGSFAHMHQWGVLCLLAAGSHAGGLAVFRRSMVSGRVVWNRNAGPEHLPAGVPLHGADRPAAAFALGRVVYSAFRLGCSGTGAVVVRAAGWAGLSDRLAGQMDWAHLLTADAVQLARWPRVPLYAEYLFWPLLAGYEEPRSMSWLPWLTFLAQAGLTAGMCLVFGAADYPEQELLRAWSADVFSRMDALLLLIWLTCAIFRTGFLCAAVRTVWQRAVQCGKGAVK